MYQLVPELTQPPLIPSTNPTKKSMIRRNFNLLPTWYCKLLLHIIPTGILHMYKLVPELTVQQRTNSLQQQILEGVHFVEHPTTTAAT